MLDPRHPAKVGAHQRTQIRANAYDNRQTAGLATLRSKVSNFKCKVKRAGTGVERAATAPLVRGDRDPVAVRKGGERNFRIGRQLQSLQATSPLPRGSKPKLIQ